MHLSATLPEPMVPAVYVGLATLPVTANGKVDRNALPAPDAETPSAQPYEAPIGDLETAVAKVWADVLKREHVSRHDNFFALGGDSILSLQIVAQANQAGDYDGAEAILKEALALVSEREDPAFSDAAANAIAAIGAPVWWTCTAHPAHLDREVLADMKRAGCSGVDIGMESADPAMLLRIGKGVTVGHGAIVHACSIGDRVLVGIGSIVLDGVVVESDVIIGAGSVVDPVR